MADREFDVILLGATGYTGKLTAEYLTQSAPTNIKWAIAGRSSSKLKAINKELKTLNSARETPSIIIVNLSPQELTELAKRTRLVLNTIGPYHQYSTPVVQACAENGTHYVDVTGETPWVREIIAKYDATAKKTGAIMVPECGVESAPSDVVAYVATRLVRQVWDCGVMDVVASLHEITSSGFSGGTLATIFGILDHYPLKYLRETLGNTFCLSPLMERDNRLAKFPKPTSYHRSIFQRLFGVWSYPDLGTLCTSATASANNAIVLRSAGLNPLFYGFNFTYEEYMRTSNAFLGSLFHGALGLFTLLLVIPPFRKLAKACLTQPGDGPTKEASTNDAFEIRAVAVAEQLNNTPRKALASFRYHGSMYALTAVTLAEGGLAILDDQDTLRKKYGAGFLTPACLGDRYVEGLERGGVKTDAKQLGDSGSK